MLIGELICKKGASFTILSWLHINPGPELDSIRIQWWRTTHLASRLSPIFQAVYHLSPFYSRFSVRKVWFRFRKVYQKRLVSCVEVKLFCLLNAFHFFENWRLLSEALLVALYNSLVLESFCLLNLSHLISSIESASKHGGKVFWSRRRIGSFSKSDVQKNDKFPLW